MPAECLIWATTISKESAVAKLYNCSELAQLAAEHCIQILGAYGIMKEYKKLRDFSATKELCKSLKVLPNCKE
jgi:alkylation response protein AidB-like acyl-CoA dehydrogenase